VTLNELKNVLKASGQAGQTKQVDGFKEVRSRKRNLIGEAARTPKKAALQTSTVTTKNFFAPLRTINMDTDAPVTEFKLNRNSNYRKIGPAAPNNTGVCSQPHPVAETTERRGITKLPGTGPG
jgi:hypothetical protein